MSVMSVQALGGYIEGLIERHGLKLADVQDRAGVRQNYVWKLTHGKIQEPGASTVNDLVRAALGDIEKALELLGDSEATLKSGYEEAMRPIFRISPRHRDRIAGMSADEIDRLFEYRESQQLDQEKNQ